MILVVILLLLFVFFFGLDIYYYSRNYINRRFLEARILDSKLWKRQVLRTNKKWLLKMPTVPIKDERRLIILDILKKNFKKKSIQSWQQASIYIALSQIFKKSSDIDIKKSLDTFLLKQNKKNLIENINVVDYGLLCYAFLLNDVADESIYNKMLEVIDNNKNKDDIVLYRGKNTEVAFVDTIGLICPFLCEYGLKMNRPELILLATKQLDFYYEKGFSDCAKLPFHAIRTSDYAPLGICGWARGFAWYLIGLMESFSCFEKRKIESNSYKNRIRELANLLVELQQEQGGFSWQLLSKNRNTDSSATAVFGWYLIRTAQIFNDDRYKVAAIKCRDFLMTVTTKAGEIDFCQGDTKGIGLYSTRFEFMPFAQGYALRLQEELEAYEKTRL